MNHHRNCARRVHTDSQKVSRFRPRPKLSDRPLSPRDQTVLKKRKVVQENPELARCPATPVFEDKSVSPSIPFNPCNNQSSLQCLTERLPLLPRLPRTVPAACSVGRRLSV